METAVALRQRENEDVNDDDEDAEGAGESFEEKNGTIIQESFD